MSPFDESLPIPRTELRRNKEAGQTLVLAALGLTVFMLSAGLAIDMGYLRYERRRMQTAADSAAIAGASELNFSDYVTAAQTDSSYNGFTNGTSGTTVTVNCPPQSGPHAAVGMPCNSQNYVEAIVSQPEPLFFMKIVPGMTSVTVSARAVGFSVVSCIYTGGGGINTSIYAGMQMDDSACGIKSGGPLSLVAPSHEITAAYIGVDGTCTGCAPNGEGGGISPYPPQTIGPPNDPFASVPAPAPSTGPCTPIPPSPATLPAGTYCGGVGVSLTGGTWTFSGNTTVTGPLQITGSANVTFQAGTYVLNGLTITGDNNIINGDNNSGVTFYNNSNSIMICTAPVMALYATGCPGNYNGDSINLTAQTSGDYAGILFFQNRSDSNTAIIVGNDVNGVGLTYLEGALYFPDAQLTFGDVTDGSDWQETYTILDANSLLLVGTVNIGSSYPTSLPRSFVVRQAVLVE